jgi:hypothetical protein
MYTYMIYVYICISMFMYVHMIRIYTFIREYKYMNLLWATEKLKLLVEDPTFGNIYVYIYIFI